MAETRGCGRSVVHVAGGGFCQACANVSNNHDNSSHHMTSSGTTAEFPESPTSDEDSSPVDPFSTATNPSPYVSSSEQISLEHTPQAHGGNLNSHASTRNHHHNHHSSQESLQALHLNTAQPSTTPGNNLDTFTTTTTPLFTFVLEALRTFLNTVNNSLHQEQASHMTFVAVEGMNIILAIHCCYP